MFGQFHHLPVHALAVHGAVVAVPLAALMGVLFAIPKTRAWARVPLVVVSVGAVVAVYVARESGKHLEKVLQANFSPKVQSIINQHYAAANKLFYFIIGFAIVAIVAFVLSRDPAKFNGVVAIATSVILILGAGLVAYQTYKVGELGSKAVWNPEQTIDYGSVPDSN